MTGICFQIIISRLTLVISSVSLHFSLEVGVKNAAFICCFVSPEYESSPRCRIELQYAHKLYKKSIPCLIKAEQDWEPVDWLKSIIQKEKHIDFRQLSDTNIHSKANYLVQRLEDLEYAPEDIVITPNILFELIKYEYLRNSKIERFINPSKSFPVEQIYTSLVVVEEVRYQKREKKSL